MAQQSSSSATRPWIKSDEIALDTSSAPWMDVAKAELGKKVHELAADTQFLQSLRQALTLDAQMQALQRQVQDFGKDSLLLGQTPAPRAGLLSKKSLQFGNPAQRAVGLMEAEKLKAANPEIDKYFNGLKTDPSLNDRRRAYDIGSTHESEGYGRITAWCAAFVNWCLVQSGSPQLGYATARSWLGFGTPVASPVYGCITVVRPSSSTGSTTGHVGFFVDYKGNNIVLLGGNQGDAVCESEFKQGNVMGYRWPTTFDHYLVGASQGTLV